MKTEKQRWHAAREVFQDCLDLPPEARAARLQARCDGEPDLLADVESLLAFHDDEQTLIGFAQGTIEAAGNASVDRYELIERIGRGGMGEVYRARRADGVYEDEVAVKLLQRGIEGDDMVRRFWRERQILATLKHSAIARLLDGGTSSDGRPYLVMELVDGIPIDRYCDENGLHLRRRIRLFAEVCRAVHFAHQSLVIHRDLKPANLLVSRRGEPKLLDFGVAKLLDSSHDLTRSLGDGGSPFTPEFAAPEQVTGGVVTTGSDVYSLGVVLYVLLTGVRPLPSRGLALAEWVEAVRHREPERPSDRMGDHAPGSASTLSGRRRAAAARGFSDPAQLRRSLAGDLDAIVLRAIHKDPARRYPSAEALARDLDRFLAGRPVQASDATARYRAGKFLRRYRGPVSATAVVVAALLILGFSLLQQRDHLLEEQAVSHEVISFLERLFEGSMPEHNRGREVPARALLDQAALDVRSRFASQPEVRARLTSVMGRAYLRLGHLKEAESLLLESMAAQQRALRAEGSFEVALDLGELRTAQGRYSDALQILESAVDRDLDPHLEGRRRLAIGRVHLFRGELEKAYRIQAEVLEMQANSPRLAEVRVEALRGFGGTARSLGDYVTARRAYVEARESARATLGEAHPDMARLDVQLGLLFHEEGRFDDAERAFLRALELQTELYPEGHPAIAETLAGIASTLLETERLDDAEGLARRSLAMRRGALGEDHPTVGDGQNLLGLVLLRKKQLDAAEAAFRDALRLHRTSLGETHLLVGGDLSNLAQALARRGDLSTAEDYVREALVIYRQALGNGHPQVATQLNNLAFLRKRRGDLDEAGELYREALDILVDGLGESHPQTASAHHNLAMLLLQGGHAQDAEIHFRGALAAFDLTLPPDHPSATLVRRSLAKSLLAQARAAEAEVLLRDTLTIHRRAGAPEVDGSFLTTRGMLARALALQGRGPKAVAMLRRDLELANEHHGPDSGVAAWLLRQLRDLDETGDSLPRQ